MGAKGKVVNVTGVEDMTAVEAGVGTLVISWVEGVGEPVEVVRDDGDVMRPGIGQLGGEAVFVLEANAGLQRVVVEVGLVFFLGNGGEAGIDAIEVGVQRPVGHPLAVSQIGERESVDVAIVVLAPAIGADVLDLEDDGRRQLTLNAQAIEFCPRAWVVVIDVGQHGREGLGGCGSRQRAGVRVREVDVGGRRLVSERRVKGCVVNIVALDTLEEHAIATANDSFAVAADVIGKPDARLPRLVVILHVAARESVHTRLADSVEIKGLAAGFAEC